MMRQAEGGEVNTEEIVLVKDRDVVRNRKKKRGKEPKKVSSISRVGRSTD